MYLLFACHAELGSASAIPLQYLTANKLTTKLSISSGKEKANHELH